MGWLDDRPSPRRVEQSSRGGLETAECTLLEPVSERAGQKLAANPARRLGAIHRSPAIFELLDAEGGQRGEFALELSGRLRASNFSYAAGSFSGTSHTLLVSARAASHGHSP